MQQLQAPPSSRTRDPKGVDIRLAGAGAGAGRDVQAGGVGLSEGTHNGEVLRTGGGGVVASAWQREQEQSPTERPCMGWLGEQEGRGDISPEAEQTARAELLLPATAAAAAVAAVVPLLLPLHPCCPAHPPPSRCCAQTR